MRNSILGMIVTTKLTTSLDISRNCRSFDTQRNGTIKMSNLLDICVFVPKIAKTFCILEECAG